MRGIHEVDPPAGWTRVMQEKDRVEPVVLVPCRSEDVRRRAESLLRQAGMEGGIGSILTFTDDEYKKVYTCWRIETAGGEGFVMKRADRYPELYAYECVFAPEDPVPRLCAAETGADGNCWLLLRPSGDHDLRDTNLPAYLRSGTALASFHANHREDSRGLHPELEEGGDIRRGMRAFLASYTRRSGDPDIAWLIMTLDRIASSLAATAPTVIHGDLLSMNILVASDRSVLIDWGASMIGSYAEDLGRWLGDLRHEDSSGWVPREWVDPVLKAYFGRMGQLLGSDWNTWQRFEGQFIAGKCLNYLAIVVSHLRHGWDNARWYEANLSALHRESGKAFSDGF
jgi:hypothetical protein